jgi:hypothetical protein
MVKLHSKAFSELSDYFMQENLEVENCDFMKRTSSIIAHISKYSYRNDKSPTKLPGKKIITLPPGRHVSSISIGSVGMVRWYGWVHRYTTC